jgi:lipoic acid synthetase
MSQDKNPKLHNKYIKKPSWLRIQLPSAEDYSRVKNVLKGNHLHTICESGACPNRGECWNAGTATFMILGNICTRNCKFCNVTSGKPLPPDTQEPENVANVVRKMKVKHCVLTSVDRDDLPDGGAEIWAKTIEAIRSKNPETTIEALIPDFKGIKDSLMMLVKANPEVISHNLETVEKLTTQVRSFAKYNLSLEVLQFLADHGMTTKSGIMLGLGESEEDILKTMDDLLKVGCRIITIGQYLQPGVSNLKVQKYVTPENFERYGKIALEKGFTHAESAPLVRSSYHAEKHI